MSASWRDEGKELRGFDVQAALDKNMTQKWVKSEFSGLSSTKYGSE